MGFTGVICLNPNPREFYKWNSQMLPNTLFRWTLNIKQSGKNKNPPKRLRKACFSAWHWELYRKARKRSAGERKAGNRFRPEQVRNNEEGADQEHASLDSWAGWAAAGAGPEELGRLLWAQGQLWISRSEPTICFSFITDSQLVSRVFFRHSFLVSLGRIINFYLVALLL